MTAEIVIMNAEGIALAADSAVTLGGERERKVLPYANKIFSLSKYHPVGIMVYGNASFMGIPWETVIKLYRAELGQCSYSSLPLYVDHFLAFLKEQPSISNERLQREHVALSVASYLSFLLNEIWGTIDKKVCDGAPIKATAVARVVSQVIRKQNKLWRKGPSVTDLPRNYRRVIKTAYNDIFEKLKKDTLENLPISRTSSQVITDTLIETLSRFPQKRY